MRKKIFIKLLILAVLALFIGIMSYRLLASEEEQAVVFIAKQDIVPFTIIDASDIEIIAIDLDSKNKLFPQSFESKKDIVGKVTIEEIKKGDVFSSSMDLQDDSEENDIIDEEGRVNINEFLGDDRIGFITIDSKNALGGQLKKGDYIDIIFTSESNVSGGVYSDILLEKLFVYSVKDNKTSSALVDIHFILSPEQGILLNLAKYNGRLDFMLTDLKTEDYSGEPLLPDALYKNLLDAGYVLREEGEASSQQATNYSHESDIENAEKKLAEAIKAMNEAKAAIDESKSMTLEEIVKTLEIAVRDLEDSVNRNTEILKEMENENE